MTDFETQCNRCPDKIWMAQDAGGAWHPMDLTNHEKPHAHNTGNQPKFESDGKLVSQAETRVRQIVHEETGIMPEIVVPMDIDRLAEAFKKFEEFKTRLLTEDDSIKIGNKLFLKKSAWRKWALACSVSDEILSQERVPLQGKEGDSFLYRITVRAYHIPTGRFSTGVAVASSNEKKSWAHEEHDVYSLCHTRAKNRAIADLVGGGEVSSEEIEKP